MAVSRKGARAWRWLAGGPWTGLCILIGQSGTMVFSLRKYRGYYDSEGQWHDVR